MVTLAARDKSKPHKLPRSEFIEEVHAVVSAYVAVFFFLAGLFSGRGLVLVAMLERRCELAYAELKLERIVSSSDRLARSGMGENSAVSVARNIFRRDIVSGWESIPRWVRQFCFEDCSKMSERIHAFALNDNDGISTGGGK